MESSLQNHILVHFWSTNAQKWWAKVSVLTPLISLDWNYSLSLKVVTLGIKVSVSSQILDFRYKSLSLEFETLEIAFSVSNLRL